MQAIVFERYGDYDELRLKEIAKPDPREHEVRIKVHASSVNSWDWELLQGVPFANRVMFGLLRPKKVNTPGVDVAGVVEAVGSNAATFKPGDAVYGDLSGGRWGGFAEYACAGEEELALKPGHLSFAEAAAVPQAGLLAFQALRYGGGVKAGEHVLINGASGGVGTFAVQLAKLAGAEVTGVCSTPKMKLVRSLGADHVIDYTREDFTRNIARYDRIIDVQARHGLFACMRALRSGGIYAFVGGNSWLVWQMLLMGPLISLLGGKKMGLMLHKANRGLEELSALLDEGSITPVIDRTFPLSGAHEAMRYFAEHRTRGKVVISVAHEA